MNWVNTNLQMPPLDTEWRPIAFARERGKSREELNWSLAALIKTKPTVDMLAGNLMNDLLSRS